MKSIERVFNRIQGKETDRVPYALLTSMYGAKLINCPLKEYYNNSDRYAEGQVAVVENFDVDIIFAPFLMTLEAETLGSELVWFEKNPPNLKNPIVKTVDDIQKLQMPDFDTNPRSLFYRETVRKLSAKYKNERVIAAICNSPTDMPAIIAGIENWIDIILFNQKAAREMLNFTGEYFIQWANALLQEGADCIITPAVFTNPTILPEHIAKEFLLPVLEKSFAQIKGPILIHHGGARLGTFFKLWKDLPNVLGFVIDPKDSFVEARKNINPTQTLFGGIKMESLAKAYPQFIHKKVTEILENRKDDKHFIFSSSNADIAYDTPIENLKEAYNTILKFEL